MKHPLIRIEYLPEHPLPEGWSWGLPPVGRAGALWSVADELSHGADNREQDAGFPLIPSAPGEAAFLA